MSNKATTYDVNPYLIGELFTGSHNFRVPEFQRSYVWSSSPNPKQERQVNLFFEDILSSSENNENYYIGSIITYPGNHYEHLLVDGQQRITTLMIFLIAFRDFQSSLEIDEKEQCRATKLRQRTIICLTKGECSISAKSKSIIKMKDSLKQGAPPPYHITLQ